MRHLNEYKGIFELESFSFDNHMERLAGMHMMALQPRFMELCMHLKDKGHISTETRLDYNDIDNSCFTVDIDDKRTALITTSQNVNFIFIDVATDSDYMDTSNFHIRRWWEVMDADEWQEKEWEDTGKTLQAAINMADWHRQYYSDMVPGNTYPSRPHLDYFLNEQLKYADCRDKGYVCSMEFYGSKPWRADRIATHLADFRFALFELGGCICAMHDDYGIDFR